MAYSTPWWYATELQALQKIGEEHSQNLKSVASTLCGLQRRMTDTSNSLVQRVEALEKALNTGKGVHKTVSKIAKKCPNDTCIGPLDALATSISDLEARFQLFSSESAAKMTAHTTALVELREQTRDGPTSNDLQACIQNVSSHSLRLEKLSEKWTELQKVQGHSSSADQLQETIRETVTQCMKELLPAEQLNKKMRRTLSLLIPSTSGITSQTNLARGIPQRVPLNACSRGVEKFQHTEQVWWPPQVPAPATSLQYHVTCGLPIFVSP
jgi:DNA repair exonuclease SbcCD ATPase subunit